MEPPGTGLWPAALLRLMIAPRLERSAEPLGATQRAPSPDQPAQVKCPEKPDLPRQRMPNASRSEPISALLNVTSPSESPAAVAGWNTPVSRAGGPFSTPVGTKSLIATRPRYPTVSTWL